MASFDGIAVFVQVARSGSFTDAARQLQTPISTVSRKVAELEASLQVQLLDRSKRRIRLTEAGTRYFEMCKTGLDMIAYANRALRDRQNETTGTLKVSVPPNVAEILFLEPIDIFLRRYPAAKLHVFVSERILDFVDDTIDLSFRVARPERQDLVIRSLLTHRHRLVAAPAYFSGRAVPRTPDQLSEHRRLGFGFQKSDDVEWQISNGSDSRLMKFEPDLAINDYAELKAAAIRGLGICELPGILCQKELEAGMLVEVLPRWRFPETTLYAVHTGTQGLSNLGRLFLDTVVKHLGGVERAL